MATPVTTPVLLTDAVVGAELLHVNVLPASVCPAAFVATAPNEAVAPTKIVVLDGCSVMFAMAESAAAAVTVMAALADFPAVVAVIVVDPAPTPVTTPDELTVAIAAAALVHVNVLPGIAAPAAFDAVAPNVTVEPVETVAVLGVTLTLATTVSAAGGVAVIDALPAIPLVVAVIVALPAATPVATPPAVTDTMAGADEDQVNVWPTTSVPDAFSAVARIVRFAPTAMEAEGGSIETAVTRLSLTTLFETPSSPPHAARSDRPANCAKRVLMKRGNEAEEDIFDADFSGAGFGARVGRFLS